MSNSVCRKFEKSLKSDGYRTDWVIKLSVDVDFFAPAAETRIGRDDNTDKEGGRKHSRVGNRRVAGRPEASHRQHERRSVHRRSSLHRGRRTDTDNRHSRVIRKGVDVDEAFRGSAEDSAKRGRRLGGTGGRKFRELHGVRCESRGE